MKLILSLLSFLFLFNFSYSQQITFEKYYDTLGCYYGNCVQQTFDGGYILCGSSYSTASAQDAAIIKTDSLGNITWVKIYGYAGTDGAMHIEQLSDSGYIVLGLKDGGYYTKTWLLRLNSFGDTLWTKDISLNINGKTEPTRLVKTFDGGYAFTGYSNNVPNGDYNAILVKTDSSGDTLWSRTFSGIQAADGYDLKQTYDSGYVITGGTGSFGGPIGGLYIVRTNMNGDSLWTKMIVDTTRSKIGEAVQQTADSGFIIAGSLWHPPYTDWDIYLVRINANGDTLWTKNIGDTTENSANSLQITSDGGFIIGGTTQESAFVHHSDVYLVRTDSLGDTLWTKKYGGSGTEIGYFVRQTNDRGYILVGETHSWAPNAVYLVKTDSTGYADSLILSTGNKENTNYVQIFPNPFNVSSTVQLHFEQQYLPNLIYEIYSASGYKITTAKITGKNFTIERNSLAIGMYLLRITDNKNISITQKFIIH